MVLYFGKIAPIFPHFVCIFTYVSHDNLEHSWYDTRILMTKKVILKTATYNCLTNTSFVASDRPI